MCSGKEFTEDFETALSSPHASEPVMDNGYLHVENPNLFSRLFTKVIRKALKNSNHLTIFACKAMSSQLSSRLEVDFTKNNRSWSIHKPTMLVVGLISI
jgi:hypothetical protein